MPKLSQTLVSMIPTIPKRKYLTVGPRSNRLFGSNALIFHSSNHKDEDTI